MSTFTLPSLARALDEMAKLQETLPAAEITALAEAGKKVLVAESARSGGIKAPISAFVLRRPTKRNGFASVALVGRGFAVLDEAGSYKKPSGYEEVPKKSGARQRKGTKKTSNETRGRAYARSLGYTKAILADGHGFFAASVHHPAQKAHPYVTAATATIDGLADAAYNRAQAAALRKVGL